MCRYYGVASWRSIERTAGSRINAIELELENMLASHKYSSIYIHTHTHFNRWCMSFVIGADDNELPAIRIYIPYRCRISGSKKRPYTIVCAPFLCIPKYHRENALFFVLLFDELIQKILWESMVKALVYSFLLFSLTGYWWSDINKERINMFNSTWDIESFISP